MLDSISLVAVNNSLTPPKRIRHKNYTERQKRILIEKWFQVKNTQTQHEFCKLHKIAHRTFRGWLQNRIVPEDSLKKAERIIRYLSKVVAKAADALAAMAYKDTHEISFDENETTEANGTEGQSLLTQQVDALDKFMEEKIDWNNIL